MYVYFLCNHRCYFRFILLTVCVAHKRHVFSSKFQLYGIKRPSNTFLDDGLAIQNVNIMPYKFNSAQISSILNISNKQTFQEIIQTESTPVVIYFVSTKNFLQKTSSINIFCSLVTNGMSLNLGCQKKERQNVSMKKERDKQELIHCKKKECLY